MNVLIEYVYRDYQSTCEINCVFLLYIAWEDVNQYQSYGILPPLHHLRTLFLAIGLKQSKNNELLG